jgi:hypothetical protein
MGERRRKLVFASAAAVLLGITLMLTLRESGPVQRRDARPERRADQSAIRTDPPAGTESGVTGPARESTTPASAEPSTMPAPANAPRREGEVTSAPAIAPRQAHAAAAAARGFLEGYLPYSYGRADAERIRAASIQLLRELEASPPRVPASVAHARPQLVSVRAEAATGGSDIDVVAEVEDGRRRYRIPLAVRNTAGRWLVTAVSG